MHHSLVCGAVGLCKMEKREEIICKDEKNIWADHDHLFWNKRKGILCNLFPKQGMAHQAAYLFPEAAKNTQCVFLRQKYICRSFCVFSLLLSSILITELFTPSCSVAESWKTSSRGPSSYFSAILGRMKSSTWHFCCKTQHKKTVLNRGQPSFIN